MWQDFVFTLGNFVFIAALIPSITSKNKPAIGTSFLTGLTVLIFSIVYTTLNLWFTAAITFATSIMWFTLVFQSWKLKKKKK
ncbi:MAG TPA: hypothetical protein VHE53_03990 [Patescibacteria group bacterium]|nr:hypothetical protein [Patescibacteria group bacterium]